MNPSLSRLLSCNRFFFVLLISLIPSLAFTEPSLPSTVSEMRAELDKINFVILDNDTRLQRLNVLVPHSEALAKKNEQNAGFQMMAGFYNAQYAGYTGGLGALKYAKKSKDWLLKSVALNPSLRGASAHVVLGSLYSQVPGWPVGFGNKKDALKHFQAALNLSPNGIDSNFTYAGYLYNQKKYTEAKIYLEKAAIAPEWTDRPLALKNIKEQIQKHRKSLEEKLNKENKTQK